MANNVYSQRHDKLGMWPAEKKKPATAWGKTAGLFYMGQTMISPEEWEVASQQCHGPHALEEWRDFNGKTFHQLHHNDNHWTYQALRFMNLPDGSSAKSREEIMAPVAWENEQLNPWKAALTHWVLTKRPSFLFGLHPRQYNPWISKECRRVADQLGLHKGVRRSEL